MTGVQTCALPISLQTVFYEGDMTEHELTEVFYRLAKQEVYPLENNPKIREAMKIAWLQSVVFKHPSFSSEREVRLVLSPLGKEYFGIKPCYHITVERIKKYYPLDLMAMCKKAGIWLGDMVEEIIIGPESTQSASILQDYLEADPVNNTMTNIFGEPTNVRRSYNLAGNFTYDGTNFRDAEGEVLTYDDANKKFKTAAGVEY